MLLWNDCLGSSIPACRDRRWIFNLATCYAGLNGRVRPQADNYPMQIARKGNVMKYFVSFGLGTAVGTLLFTGLLSAAHEFDWGRALFVGLFVGLAGAGLSSLTQKKKQDR